MDQLTNDNFKLKLEVHHRRERQESMEAEIEKLKLEQEELVKTKQRLIQDQGQRDEAFKEAVAMIITLEARVEEQGKTIAWVNRLREDPFGETQNWSTGSLAQQHPLPIPIIGPRPTHQDKVIDRMPSFLSEPTEATENLRIVYLTSKGSAMSLHRASNGSPTCTKSALRNLASSTFSTLSTSSFPSVYGSQERVVEQTSSPRSKRTVGNGQSDQSPRKQNAEDDKLPVGKTRQNGVESRAESSTRTHGAQRMPSISGIVHSSPVQQTSRHDQIPTTESSRPQSQGMISEGHRSEASNASPRRQRTKEDKREALRRLAAEPPGGVQLRDHQMPRTPETHSVAILPHFKTSDETLAHSRFAPSEQSYELRSQVKPEKQQDFSVSKITFGTHDALTTENMQKRDSTIMTASNYPSQSLRRPRSVDETTVSRRDEYGWESDEASSDEPDAPSLVASDIWMRESARSGRRPGRIPSPDMFGIPSAGGDWAARVMSDHNSTLVGGVSLGTRQIDGLFTGQDPLFQDGIAPPTPHRSSSLQAALATKSKTLKPDQPLTNVATRRSRRQRHIRRNSDDLQGRRDVTQGVIEPEPTVAQVVETPKASHPPITIHHGARHGLNKLFRRSIGSSVPKVEAAAPTKSEHGNADNNMGDKTTLATVVSRSAAVEDDRSGATPPPILRNPRQRSELDSDQQGTSSTTNQKQDDAAEARFAAAEYYVSTGHPLHPETAQENDSYPPQKRKWLPFSRNSSSGIKSKLG